MAASRSEKVLFLYPPLVSPEKHFSLRQLNFFASAEVELTVFALPPFVHREEESASFELFQADHHFTLSSTAAAVCVGFYSRPI